MTYALLSLEDFKARFPETVEGMDASLLHEPIAVCTETQTHSGDFSLEGKTSVQPTANSYVFLSDLIIDGNLINWSGDVGANLFVNGTLNADNIIAGGSFIDLNRAIIKGCVLGHYNDGHLIIRDFQGDLVISDDHSMFTPSNQRYVSITHDVGRPVSLSVDDINLDLSYSDRLLFEARTLMDFFKQTEWFELETDSSDPDEIFDALDNNEYQIRWYDWVGSVVDQGRSEAVQEFQRLVDYCRDRYSSAPPK